MTQLEIAALWNPRNIGALLGRLCVTQFEAVQDAAAGIGYGSCSAAVAVNPHAFYPAVAGTRIAVVYGNSQIFRGLDPEFNRHSYAGQGLAPPSGRSFANSQNNEEHAEQIAIRTAVYTGVGFFQSPGGACHIFVELSPCAHCTPWLQNRPERWIVYYLYNYATQAQDFSALKRSRQRFLPPPGPPGPGAGVRRQRGQ